MPGLNSAQKSAVQTPGGPVLVLAGAGTGKTRVVTHRIANLIRRGIEPPRILAVTFTNKAAGEMQQRISEILKGRTRQRPQISTFHALCVKILRRHIQLIGYPQRFVICNRGDQEGFARRALREINAPETAMSPSQLVSQIGLWKSQSIGPRQSALLADSDFLQVAAAAYRRYQSALKTQGAVDFDDLLLLVEQLFDEFPDVMTREAQQFDHILIDEYQDTNLSQYRIIKSLAGHHRNLCVVGDDDQSIYGFRGADVSHILNFRDDWPDAAQIRLEENFRSTKSIIHLANQLISFNLDRHDKTLRTARPPGIKPGIQQYPNETKEAQEVVAQIRNRLAAPGVEPGDFAILFRTNEQPRPFETELRKADLPYVLIGGMSFFDRKEIKDVVAYLRLMSNPLDELALRRIANTPPRGLSNKTMGILLRQAAEHQVGLWGLFENQQSRPSISAAAHRGMDQLHQLVTGGGGPSLVDQVRALIDRCDYQRELQRAYPDPLEREVRWNNVQQIVNAVGEYERDTEQPDLGEFMDLLALDDRQLNEDKEKKLNSNCIALMTMHCAKGLEFPEVFLVGLEEGILPHHRSLSSDATIDEERRLCYVGITRAQERLTLTMALSRLKWGKPQATMPSRFLYEMTGQADHPKYLACTALEAGG